MEIKLEDVSFHYENKCALERVSCTLTPGFNVLLGPNGAGKSTLFSLLTGLLPLTQGSISYDNQTLALNRRTIMSNIGVVFQQNTLDVDLTIRQNLAYFASLQGRSPTQSLNFLSDILDNLGLTERLDWKVRQLNGGHRRRVEIARCLIHSPSVLLLDEPTVGLDIGSRSMIVKFIHDIAKQRNITVLWTTHLLEEIDTDDYVMLLNNGQLKGQGPCHSLLAEFDCDDVPQLFEHILKQG